MAHLSVRTFSPTLSRITQFEMLIPNDVAPYQKENNPHYARPMKTLFLLHGYCGDRMDWLSSSRIGELSTAYNLAVIMPSGENSFYLNQAATGFKFEDYLCRELVEYVRSAYGLALAPEDTFISGLSMGGFGALHSCLAHPEAFGKCMGLSSALICGGISKMEPGTGNGVANYEYYAQMFGDPAKLDVSMNNPEYVVKTRLEKGDKLQPVYMACGSEDFLIEPNRDFANFLKEKGADITFIEAPGVHDWKFWNEFIEPAIKWALEV